VHFFEDDSKFDEVWNKPEQYIQELGKYKQVMTPPGPDATRAEHQIYWRRRQDALPTNKIVDNLESHEVKFYERLTSTGQRVRLIPKDRGRPAKPTNDFVWQSKGGILVEVKSVQKAKYDSIALQIRNAVSKAKVQNVVKENFIIALGSKPTSKLLNQLSQFNIRNPLNKISCLWVEHLGELIEIKLHNR